MPTDNELLTSILEQLEGVLAALDGSYATTDTTGDVTCTGSGITTLAIAEPLCIKRAVTNKSDETRVFLYEASKQVDILETGETWISPLSGAVAIGGKPEDPTETGTLVVSSYLKAP